MLRTLIPQPFSQREKGANPNVVFRTPKSPRPAIDTGDPRTVFTKVSINVVHTNRIPSGTARHEYRTRSHFFFAVACGGQLLNLEGANLRPINRKQSCENRISFPSSVRTLPAGRALCLFPLTIGFAGCSRHGPKSSSAK